MALVLEENEPKIRGLGVAQETANGEVQLRCSVRVSLILQSTENLAQVAWALSIKPKTYMERDHRLH